MRKSLLPKRQKPRVKKSLRLPERNLKKRLKKNKIKRIKEEIGSPGIGIAGKDAFPTTVEAGVEGRISIISGKGSASGTGILKDVKITEW